MSIMQSDIQWFIAREGKQHGPLNDAEMRVFVERGHLRPTDLIWRQGFPDWRPAPAVFAPQRQPAPPPRPQAPPQPLRQHMSTGPGSAGPGRLAPRYEPTLGRPAGYQPMPGPAERTGGRSAHPRFGGPYTGGAQATPQRTELTHTPHEDPDDHEDYEEPRRGRALLILVLLALIGGGGWFAYKNKETLTAYAGKVIAERTSKTAARIDTTPPPPIGKASALEERLQASSLWRYLKVEFPYSYSELIKSGNALAGAGKPEAEITTHLVKGLVAMRREYADKALAANTIRLKALATAFLANLKELAGRDKEACYGFISKGETSPAVLSLVASPADESAMFLQLKAVFEAVVDGRKLPNVRNAPTKEDYDVLKGELRKLGWTDADVSLMFGDPKVLGQAPHDRVCQMVQDFFSAHFNVANAGVQERLLFETLRPVVSGG